MDWFITGEGDIALEPVSPVDIDVTRYSYRRRGHGLCAGMRHYRRRRSYHRRRYGHGDGGCGVKGQRNPWARAVGDYVRSHRVRLGTASRS